MSNKSSPSCLIMAVLFGVGVMTIPAYAVGGGTTSTTIIPTCKKNMVWDKKTRKCVKVKKSSRLDDNNIYEGARDLAFNKRYEEAITLLKLAENKNDPRILNYLGYSNRKLGRVEQGLVYYQAALKVDPDYTLVMEYMGEAFLQLDQVDKAREQLTAIEKRCGVNCREYTMLDTEIKRYLSRKG